MLRNIKDMVDFALEATDGGLGHVRDFYFDDEAWVIRYLVVETGYWLSNRKVLISPMSMGEPNWTLQKLPVRLTLEQVRASPRIDTDKPVSRQYEEEFGGYYAYPNYWGSSGLWGAAFYPWNLYTGAGYGGVSGPGTAPGERQRMAHVAAKLGDGNPHLRSCNTVIGYHIHAADGDIGHVQGILVDEKTWAIRYLIINTSNWWLGHDVLVAPEWITDVSWTDRKVMIGLTRQAIQDAPRWDPARPLDRLQETSVYQHYGRKGYWDAEGSDAAAPRVNTERSRAHS